MNAKTRAIHRISLGVALSSQAIAATAAPSWTERLTPTTSLVGEPESAFSVENRMAHYSVPALSIAVVEGCRVVEANAFGRMDAGAAAVNPKTRFQAGSISKVVTAVGALRLVEQGGLSLDRDVRKDIQGWTADGAGSKTPLTLRQLLSHTGGINVHGFEGYAAGTVLPTLEQILEGRSPANNSPLRVETAPGSQFQYSGGGYMLVQALMAPQGTQHFASLIDRTVLRPLRMGDSSFVALGGQDAKLALAHDRSGNAMVGGWKRHPELAAAGLWSTPTDLSKLAIGVMRSARGEPGAIMRRTTAAEMITAQPPGSWGLGLELRSISGTKVFMHTGQTDGYLSAMFGIPAMCSGTVVMLNGDGGTGLMREVVRAIAASRNWPELVPATKLRRLGPAEVGRLTGKYLVDKASFDIEIRGSAAGGPELLIGGAKRGAIYADAADRLLVTSPDLEPLATIQLAADGSFMLLLGERRYLARPDSPSEDARTQPPGRPSRDQKSDEAAVPAS